MKALRECSWKIEILQCTCNCGGFYWSANPGQEADVRHQCGEDFVSKSLFKTTELAVRNWEKFAKLNRIKKWKIVRVEDE